MTTTPSTTQTAPAKLGKLEVKGVGGKRSTEFVICENGRELLFSAPDAQELTNARGIIVANALCALADQQQAEGPPSDVGFKIVSEWLQQEGTAANGDQLYTMCRFVDFVLNRAPVAPGDGVPK